MRKVDRIDDFCDRLKLYWKLVPDWRFGQLICNVFGSFKVDPFFPEEDTMLEFFDQYFAQYGMSIADKTEEASDDKQ